MNAMAGLCGRCMVRVLGKCNQVFRVVTLFYIATSSTGEFQLFHILARTWYG